MSTSFTPPPISSWEGPANNAGSFTPPPISSWEGPADTPSSVPNPGAQMRDQAISDINEYMRGDDVSGATGGGFWSNAADAVKDAVIDPLAQTIHRVTHPFNSDFDPSNDMPADPGVGGIPLVSTGIKAGMEATSGNLPGAVGTIAGTGAAIAAPVAIGKGVATTAKGVSSLVSGLDAIPPEQLIMKSLRGSVPQGRTGFMNNLQRSLPDIKAIEPQLGKPIQSVDDLLGNQSDPNNPGAIQLAKRANREQYAQLMGPQQAMGAQIDLSPVADAMEATISPKMQLKNPAGANAMRLEASVYRHQFPIDQVDSFLRTTNAELDAYYGKNPGARRQAAAANPDTAMTAAEADALRKALYGYLDAPGQGAAAQELQRRYGALTELQEAMERRKNVALRQAPDSLSQQVGKWQSMGDAARAVGNMLRGNPAGAILDGASALAKSRAATWLKEQNATDSLIARAFRNHNTPAAPIEMPPPVNPRALLNSAPLVTPAPKDASGPAPFTPPASWNQPGYGFNPQRRLPAAAITPEPPIDTSGLIPTELHIGRGVSPSIGNRSLPAASQRQLPGFAVTDAIPIRNPDTGQIEYIPQHMANFPPQSAMEPLSPGEHTFRNGQVWRKNADGTYVRLR